MLKSVATSSDRVLNRLDSGNDWTFTNSADCVSWDEGVSFNQALTVNSVGLFAATIDGDAFYHTAGDSPENTTDTEPWNMGWNARIGWLAALRFMAEG